MHLLSKVAVAGGVALAAAAGGAYLLVNSGALFRGAAAARPGGRGPAFCFCFSVSFPGPTH
jgi:hypothetical protein